MQVDAGELINTLREKLSLKLDANEADVLAAFDRSCVEVLVATHNGNARKELTSGQKGALTRAKNKAAALKQAEGETEGASNG